MSSRSHTTRTPQLLLLSLLGAVAGCTPEQVESAAPTGARRAVSAVEASDRVRREALAELAPEAPLILQPVTPFGGIDATPSARTLLETLWACERIHADVRLIPQTHRFYGAL